MKVRFVLFKWLGRVFILLVFGLVWGVNMCDVGGDVFGFFVGFVFVVLLLVVGWCLGLFELVLWMFFWIFVSGK